MEDPRERSLLKVTREELDPSIIRKWGDKEEELGHGAGLKIAEPCRFSSTDSSGNGQ